MTDKHDKFMRRALDLAANGEGLTRPNPPVGAVIVKSERIIAEGWHKKAGTAHAERVALENAGLSAKGATLYVTLEPCCTHGRTSPCTEAIIAAGIKTVVAASTDPNPKHSGRGFIELEKNGVKVIHGICKAEGDELIAPFAKWITTGLPLVTLKLGMSLDGKISDRIKNSKWITGPESRERVQAMRRKADAIMVGAGTVKADNPQLQPRPAYGRTLWRVVVDADAQIPVMKSKVMRDEFARQTIMAVKERCAAAKRKEFEYRGAQVIRMSRQNPLRFLLGELGKMGIMHVLCEGGGELAFSLIGEQCVDRFAFFVAPVIIGGWGSTGSVGGPGWLMDNLPRVVFTAVERVGNDILILARPDDLRQSARLE